MNKLCENMKTCLLSHFFAYLEVLTLGVMMCRPSSAQSPVYLAPGLFSSVEHLSLAAVCSLCLHLGPSEAPHKDFDGWSLTRAS